MTQFIWPYSTVHNSATEGHALLAPMESSVIPLLMRRVILESGIRVGAQ